MSTHGYGTKLQVGDGGSPEAFTDVAGVTDINPPETTLDTIETTAHDSANAFKEFIGGLLDGGEFSATMNFNVNDTQHTLLRTNHLARTVNNYKIVLPSSIATFAFAALVTKVGIPTPIGDKISQVVSFKITAKPTIS